MASQKAKHTETTISEEQKKALMCGVHFQGSASKAFVCSPGCQRPENRLEKLSRYLQMETYKTCRLTKSNGRFMKPNA